MSRTHAHVPARVELGRINPMLLEACRFGHWRPSMGNYPCFPLHNCEGNVPDWASTQRHARHGNATVERRGAIRDRLRAAAREYRTTGEVLDCDVMPDPVRHCLCQHCGVR